MRIVDDFRDGKMLGLRGTTNGRSCEQHAWYGSNVRPNDSVQFNKAPVVPIHGVDQSGIKAVLILDGMELCTIGFLGKNIAALEENK